MNKRIILWGSLTAVMALIIIVTVWFAGNDETQRGQANSAANSNVSAAPAILEPRESDWKKGNPDADVVIVKYSDFQCPACRYFASMDDELSEEMSDDVLFVYRHFPLQNFEYSRLAARYAEAAGRQGQFWRMHDLLFINQPRWSRGDAESIFQQFAESMDLDMEQFEEDLEDSAIQDRIDTDYREGRQVGVQGVPSVFINGEKIQSPGSVEDYRSLIESYL